ncbi:Hydroxysqualene synthase [Burkholderiaceae bacterium]|nr:Hydroxysqualene synthase [Burkholderiaceae bacterium]
MPWTMRAVSVEHYENFPVASLLCPPRLRPAVVALYGFARTADDLADEGDATPEQRLVDLARYRRDLDAVLAGEAPSGRWATVFVPLAAAIRDFRLPGSLLHDLLSAFEQDVIKHDYTDRADLLDYCRRSANPVGRLVLQLHGIHDDAALTQSDAICTALQLTNFWQDMRIDTARGRLYPPRADRLRRRVSDHALLSGEDSDAARRLLADLVSWARSLMLSGSPLVHRVPGRAGWELRLVVQGGLRILEKIEALDHATLRERPTLRWFDAPLLLWRAVCMRPPMSALARTTP